MIGLMEALAQRLQVDAVRRPHGRSATVMTAPWKCRSSPRYWGSESSARRFEASVGRELADATRWVFGTRLVALDLDEGLRMRRLDEHRPLVEGEEELIWLLGVDLESGLDVGRVIVQREADQKKVRFGPLEVTADEVALVPGAPGYHLLQTVLGGAV